MCIARKHKIVCKQLKAQKLVAMNNDAPLPSVESVEGGKKEANVETIANPLAALGLHESEN